MEKWILKPRSSCLKLVFSPLILKTKEILQWFWLGIQSNQYEKGIYTLFFARYANHYGLKGAFVWEIDTDNFLGDFGKEKYTISKAIARALESGKGLEENEQLGEAQENGACAPQAPLCDPTDYTPTIPTLSTYIPGPTTTSMRPETTTTAEHECNEVNCRGDGDLVSYPGKIFLLICVLRLTILPAGIT